MKQHIVIAGSSFAGAWAALSAARAVSLAGKTDTVDITVVSPEPVMHIRPRLYEATLDNMAPDLSALFDAVGVRHLAGWVNEIDSKGQQVQVKQRDGQSVLLKYDRFVLATGSQVVRPPLPGLAEHAFDVDQLDHAQVLDAHLKSLATKPESKARNTVVVIGGGFTGIEAATEMPLRLRKVFGEDAPIRVVLVEKAPVIGPDLGPTPRPVIEEALASCGIEVLTAVGVTAIDADGVTIGDKKIEASTVIWTAGVRANPLAAMIGTGHDNFGRVPADSMLRAVGTPAVFVAGDVARAATDDVGNVAAMSCQHALSLGRVAGHNAAAELVGLPLHPYSQPKYVTCLDLGDWGALYTEGWDRQIFLKGAEGKALKQQINTQWIYPPAPDREAVFGIANPDFVIVP
jgi:NADH:ubiquinone reductase (H+-translocating)